MDANTGGKWIQTGGMYATSWDSTITSLATFRDSGMYYMTTTQAAAITDHPFPASAGWWLEVSKKDAGGNVMQRLIKNTYSGDYMEFKRGVKTDGTFDDWYQIGGLQAPTIKASITALSNVTIPNTYYMSTADSSRFTDHPAPGVAGWWLEVSQQNGNGDLVQELKRNTSSDIYDIYYRTVTSTHVGAWAKFTLSDALNPFPSGVTDLKTINTPGKYYLTTAQVNALTDTPQANTTSGWFLEVSPKNSNGAFFQTMRNNVMTTGNVRMMHRMLDGAGGASGWKNHVSEKIVLWSGNCKADFTTNFALSEPLSNFDFVYFQITSDLSANGTDRWVYMPTWASNTIQFAFNNISDTNGTTGFWLFEYQVQFDATLSTFKNLRCTRLKIDPGTTFTQTRTDSDGTIGLTNIVGVRL
jgi:hypothetical protein